MSKRLARFVLVVAVLNLAAFLYVNEVLAGPKFCTEINDSTGWCDVGSYYNPVNNEDRCYVNHWWCEDPNADSITCELLDQAVKKASYSKDCGAEQIDVACFGDTTYDNIDTRHGPCKKEKPKPDPSPTITSTPTATLTPTPTFTPTPTITNTPKPRQKVATSTPTPYICFEMDVRRADQVDRDQEGNIISADQVRLFTDDSGNLRDVKNMTGDYILDPDGVLGTSLHGSIEPVQGCLMAFQQAMPGQDGWDVWVTDTGGVFLQWDKDTEGENTPRQLTKEINTNCSIEPEWDVEGRIWYSNICEDNRIYHTDKWGLSHRQYDFSGVHVDACLDGVYISFTDNDGYVNFYNTRSGQLSVTSQQGEASWNAECSEVDIYHEGSIQTFNFRSGELTPYHEGEAAAHDPRKAPVFDLLEMDAQLFSYVPGSDSLKPIDNPGLLYWESSWEHTDPEWWVYYLHREEPDSSHVAGSLSELASEEVTLEVLPTAQVSSSQSEGAALQLEQEEGSVSEQASQEEQALANTQEESLMTEAGNKVQEPNLLDNILLTGWVWNVLVKIWGFFTYTFTAFAVFLVVYTRREESIV